MKICLIKQHCSTLLNMKKHTGFRCDAEARKEAQAVAKELRRSLSYVIETALIEYLSKKKKGKSGGSS